MYTGQLIDHNVFDIAKETLVCKRMNSPGEWKSINVDDCLEGIAIARTMAFITICFAENFRAFTVRNYLRSFWYNFFDNKSMIIGSIISLGLSLIIIFINDINYIFGLTSNVPWEGWLLSIAGALLTVFIDERIKMSFYTSVKASRRWRFMEQHLLNILNEIRTLHTSINKCDDSNLLKHSTSVFNLNKHTHSLSSEKLLNLPSQLYELQKTKW
jgi:magnesium-transporting ATPase (P-type)